MCPECGSKCRVLQTRFPTPTTTRRRYECEKAHRFTTFELLYAGISPYDQQSFLKACEKVRVLFERNATVAEAVRSGSTVPQVAKQYQIPEDTVLRIVFDTTNDRKKHANPNDDIHPAPERGKRSADILRTVWPRKDDERE
jgi:transcriptional regulator NrdR family protein